MLTLDGLKVGQRGRILVVGGEPALVQRLLEMGMLEGEEIEVVAFAPLGDPIEISCRFGRLSLRRREAAGIQVERI